MGAILLIEDDRDLHGLIEKIFAKRDLKVLKTFSLDQEEIGESLGAQTLKAGLPMALEEVLREYLRAGIGSGKEGNIHEFVIGRVERALIGLILEEEKGNQVRAAKRLGINRNTLRKRMRDLHIITKIVAG